MFPLLSRILLNILLIMIIAASYLIYSNLKDLPNFSKLENYSPPIVTRFYASDGRLLEEYAKEHRLFVPIEAIPKQLQYAFIAAEDKNFYTHPGIDLMGIMRAVLQNIINITTNKKSLVGGSTITQQVIKNFLLSNEKTIDRKIKEAILAYRISEAFSKDKILELYLNQIYLGSRAYGVASAALTYFNKSINELNIEESALLASLPKAPSALINAKNKDRIKYRRNWVLDRMAEDGYISKTQAQEAKDKPIIMIKKDVNDSVKADYFAEAVRQQIAEKYGEKTLYEDGLYVRTTLDPKLQKIAEKSFKKGIIQYDHRHGYRGISGKINDIKNWKEQLNSNFNFVLPFDWEYVVILESNKNQLKIGTKNGTEGIIIPKNAEFALTNGKSLSQFKIGDVIIVDKISESNYSLQQIPKANGGIIVMDPHLGRVLAMVGGFDSKVSKFNRVYQALRQSGSSYKTFVYLLALENNYKPNMIINDAPISISQGPGMPLWQPRNYHRNFLGETTLRRGLELSRNTMTVQLASMLGINKIIDITKRFNINDNPPPYLSMVLGSIETTLLRMTNAYAMVVNGGKKVSPTLIEKIQDQHGNILFSSDQRECINCEIDQMEYKIPHSVTNLPYILDKREHVTDERSAYQLTSILEGVISHTKSCLIIKNLNRTLAGKTGTTNESKDTWFIGFSPDLVVGTYVGFDQPASLGARETGATVAAPIFADFMKEALKDKPDIPFRMPKGLKLERIDYETGENSSSNEHTIYEVFKDEQLD